MTENAANTGKRLLEENKGSIYPAFAYSVLDNYIDGEVLIDESATLIGTASGIYVAAGNDNSDSFSSQLMQIFRDRKRSNQRFTLFSPSKPWDDRIHALFGGELRPLQRYSFQFNENDFLRTSKTKLPDDFQLEKINQANLHNSKDFNESYIIKYWGSVERFLEKGFGCAITQNNVNASECISIFSSSKYAEVDIVTQEQFKGKGLAQYTAKAFIIECLERKLTPRWDCDVHNHASIKLAGKAGFANPETYSVFVRR